MIKITDIKTNPNNPRLIKDEKFAKLVKSINEFPKMMELRPLVVNADNVILGGNMRFKALKELGYTNIPKEWVKRADELTEDETRRFIIADNVGFGEHDWDLLANDWDSQELEEWGLDVWQNNSQIVDYINNGDENSEWIDMPEFKEGEGYIQCNIIFASESEREEYIENNLSQYKTIIRNKQKIVYFGTEK
tara:strand:- start:176 stop:751 length:576 start_codon:yes stop_codon:yes gene_type:complete